MSTHKRDWSTEPLWCDVVMRMLPGMYHLGEVIAQDDYVFVYSTTFLSAREEMRRGATDEAIRRQRSRILRFIDEADRSDYDKELFAATLRAPWTMHSAGEPRAFLQTQDWPGEPHKAPPGLSLNIGDVLDCVR